MTRALPLALLLVVPAIGCDCRPVPPTDWQALDIHCNGNSDFASNGSEQVMLDTQQTYEDFLRRDCLRGDLAPIIPDVDFSRDVVLIDVTLSPFDDGTCVQDRAVVEVDVCHDGLQVLYQDTTDPDCNRRRLTGAVAVRRTHVRAALAPQPR